MIAPASDQVAEQFGATNTVVIAMMTSIFVLAYGTVASVLPVLSSLTQISDSPWTALTRASE